MTATVAVMAPIPTLACAACASGYHAWSQVEGLGTDTIVLIRQVCVCLCRCNRRSVSVSTPVAWHRQH